MQKVSFKMASKRSSSSSSSVAQKRAKSAICHHSRLLFRSDSSKSEFQSRLDRAKQRLFPGAGSVDNFQLLSGLLDALDGGGSSSSDTQGESGNTVVQPMLDSSGRYY